MDRRFVFWLAPGIVTFTFALAGCQKKEERFRLQPLHRSPRRRPAHPQTLAL